VNAIATAVARWLADRRARRPLRVVDQAPLFGGAVVHVVDLDARRFVFATAQGAICLLAQFERAAQDVGREGGRDDREEIATRGRAQSRT